MATWIPDDISGPFPIEEVHNTRVESHNTINGSPVFKVRLNTQFDHLDSAQGKLLGTPLLWPHASLIPFKPYCVAMEVPPDMGRYSSDIDQQLVYPDGNVFIDCTYVVRTGVYLEDYNNQDVYWEDQIEPRIESRAINHRQLVWGATDAQTIPTKKIQLMSDEAPPKYESGETLIHIIEGWTDTTVKPNNPTLPLMNYLTSHIGTVALSAYTSIPLGRTFEAKTLLLRNVSITRSFSFRSYRLPPGGSTTHYSGKPTNTIRMIYEYKKEGWDKFWRIDLENDTEGFYYIRRNKEPYGIVRPFPEINHDVFLRYTSLIMNGNP